MGERLSCARDVLVFSEDDEPRYSILREDAKVFDDTDWDEVSVRIRLYPTRQALDVDAVLVLSEYFMVLDLKGVERVVDHPRDERTVPENLSRYWIRNVRALVGYDGGHQVQFGSHPDSRGEYPARGNGDDRAGVPCIIDGAARGLGQWVVVATDRAVDVEDDHLVFHTGFRAPCDKIGEIYPHTEEVRCGSVQGAFSG